MQRGFCTFALAAALSLAGCKGKPSGEAPKAESASAVEAKVLAKVGDRTITVGDFLEALANLDEIDRARFEAPARRKELLDALVETEALAQEARAKGLEKEPAVAQELRMALRDAMLREIHRSVPKAEALEVAEVRAYYDAHAASYAEPERRRLQAIVVASEAEAKKVLTALGAAPTAQRFGELVKSRSTDASAKTGAPLDLLGDVGFVSAPGDDRGTNARIPEAVRKAAHALAGVGAVSEPIAAEGAFWVVRVTSVSAARSRSFEEVEKTLRIALAQEKRRAAEKAKLAELAKAAKIDLDPQALEAVFKAGATP